MWGGGSAARATRKSVFIKSCILPCHVISRPNTGEYIKWYPFVLVHGYIADVGKPIKNKIVNKLTLDIIFIPFPTRLNRIIIKIREKVQSTIQMDDDKAGFSIMCCDNLMVVVQNQLAWPWDIKKWVTVLRSTSPIAVLPKGRGPEAILTKIVVATKEVRCTPKTELHYNGIHKWRRTYGLKSSSHTVVIC